MAVLYLLLDKEGYSLIVDQLLALHLIIQQLALSIKIYKAAQFFLKVSEWHVRDHRSSVSHFEFSSKSIIVLSWEIRLKC